MNNTDEVREAMELLRGEPSAEIESPRIVTERRGKKLVDVERGAFIKLYASFKRELKTLEGGDLKIWTYLALSVNRQTKDARPGLRTMAEDLDMAVNTIRAGLERLEAKGLLDIEKEDGQGNIYHPADYVSVSKFDTPTVSNSGGTVSNSGRTVSTSLLQTAQLEELELTRVENPLSIENSIFLGLPVTPETVDIEKVKTAALRQFENALGFSKPLPWWGKGDWPEFSEWVVARFVEDRLAFATYNIWRNTKYTKGGMTNNRIRGFVTEFYDSWDTFRMAYPLAVPEEETIPATIPLAEFEKTWSPRQ